MYVCVMNLPGSYAIDRVGGFEWITDDAVDFDLSHVNFHVAVLGDGLPFLIGFDGRFCVFDMFFGSFLNFVEVAILFGEGIFEVGIDRRFFFGDSDSWR